jgi:hypothetical protein
MMTKPNLMSKHSITNASINGTFVSNDKGGNWPSKTGGKSGGGRGNGPAKTK